MKKHVLPYWLCLIFLISVVTLTGCQQNRYINDPKTGAVTVENESKLKDGAYAAHGAFRGNDGYAPFLKINVKNGIITKAAFSEKDENGKVKTGFSDSAFDKKYTDPEDYYQALESALITHQNADELPEEGSQTAIDFKNLTDTALKNAESGITADAAVNLDRAYTAAGTTAESAPRRYKAVITYKKGKIDSVDFDVDNSTLADRSQIGEMVDRTIKADSLSEVAFNAKTPEEAALLAAYNEALAAVAAKRLPVQAP